MAKIDLATFESFKQTLLASGDGHARTSILLRPESEIRQTYRKLQLVDDINKLQRPGKGYTSIEWHASKEGSFSTGYLKASLIWCEFNWLAGAEPSPRLWLTENACIKVIGAETLNKRWMLVGTRPPPQKPFVPIPKSEIGGCARSDSSAPALLRGAASPML
jgi:hypothetical protein